MNRAIYVLAKTKLSFLRAEIRVFFDNRPKILATWPINSGRSVL